MTCVQRNEHDDDDDDDDERLHTATNNFLRMTLPRLMEIERPVILSKK
jgi:hypothetical protein